MRHFWVWVVAVVSSENALFNTESEGSMKENKGENIDTIYVTSVFGNYLGINQQNQNPFFHLSEIQTEKKSHQNLLHLAEKSSQKGEQL